MTPLVVTSSAGAPSERAPAQYQTTFEQLGADGYRLELVSGYSVKGQDRIATIWTK